MTPARGLLLVRPVETDETMPGGVIALIAETRERMTANQCEVIAVGAFAECDPARSRAERKCDRLHVFDPCVSCTGCASPCPEARRVHAHPIQPSDWLLVRPRSYIAGPTPERKEWFVHQDAVLAIFRES